jgi:hypothetical protein
MKHPSSAVLVIVAALLTASCGRVSPATPSDPASPPIAPADATGQVVSIESVAGGISDVVISGMGGREARTDARGFFTLDANTSTYSLLLKHPDYVDRRTAVRLPANGLQVSMIPSTFDQAAFEEFAPRATTTGLRRWTEDPSLVVLTNVVNYEVIAFDPLVTDRRVADADLACLRDGMQKAIGMMSDGVLTFKKVEMLSLPAGSRFSIPSTNEGTIVVAATRGLGANGRASAFAGNQPGVLVRGIIWVTADNLSLCGSTAARVYPHELGHALGYQHVMLEPSVMSGIQPSNGLTAFDRDALRIIYQRPPGNHVPDIDPPTYVIN